jgi:hypothetical protein
VAGFSQFITKTTSLKDGEGEPEKDKGLELRVGHLHSGKAVAKGRTKWGVEGQVN